MCICSLLLNVQKCFVLYNTRTKAVIRTIITVLNCKSSSHIISERIFTQVIYLFVFMHALNSKCFNIDCTVSNYNKKSIILLLCCNTSKSHFALYARIWVNLLCTYQFLSLNPNFVQTNWLLHVTSYFGKHTCVAL